MSASDAREPAYVVPTYRSPPDAAWYHALNGNVPGHQIDYLYRPEVPQGPLTQQHASHLDRLVQCIEPRSGSLCAFAIGNLSRDDTQHEAGHGAVALLVALRLRGALDHAGRRDPPFAHAVMAIDRHLDRAALFRAAMYFHDQIVNEGARGPGPELVEMYSRFMRGDIKERAAALQAYLASFEGLPRLGPSRLGAKWRTGSSEPPRRVRITHADGAPFEAIARCAARVAAVLYQSDLRWSSITTGREADVPNGVSVRFVPARDADERAADGLVLPIDQVPEDEATLARHLFELSLGGQGQAGSTRPLRRQVFAAPIRANSTEAPTAPAPAMRAATEEARVDRAPASAAASNVVPPAELMPTAEARPDSRREDVSSPVRVPRRSRRWLWVGVTFLAVGVGFIAGLRGGGEAVDARTLAEIRKVVRESDPPKPAPEPAPALAIRANDAEGSPREASYNTGAIPGNPTSSYAVPKPSRGQGQSSSIRKPRPAGTVADWVHSQRR